MEQRRGERQARRHSESGRGEGYDYIGNGRAGLDRFDS